MKRKINLRLSELRVQSFVTALEDEDKKRIHAGYGDDEYSDASVVEECEPTGPCECEDTELEWSEHSCGGHPYCQYG